MRQYAVVIHEKYGRILPYEIDAYGNYYCIDDGNVPSLLSLPYLDAVGPGDPLYLNTRQFVLSDSNPYYCIGKAASGPGGPHVGRDMIWPLGLIVQALTSRDDQEVRQMPPARCKRPMPAPASCTRPSTRTTPNKFTRAWFAWANTIFGELILKSYQERAHVLN